MFSIATLAGAGFAEAQSGGDFPVRLITLDPGHFHAALVQKTMYPGVDPVVHVYAPAGDELDAHLKLVDSFNTRTNEPTHWQEKVYTGRDFLDRMLAEKAGNVVVIAGNNRHKTEYILAAARAGLNVLADKPMAITPKDFQMLREAFTVATSNHVLLWDIMTERHEITSALQAELSRQPELFGQLAEGSPGNPTITEESTHSFSKLVAGASLKRPPWFFDVRQQGEGIVDVSTHLVDLVQLELFPQTPLDPSDVTVQSARHWSTILSREQFQQLTGATNFPTYLSTDVRAGLLNVRANGEFTYRIKGVWAKVSVDWEFQSPGNGADQHRSVLRGTLANLVIRQGEHEHFKPVLYVEKTADETDAAFEASLATAVRALQTNFPGIGFTRDGNAWRITVPDRYDTGHEAHFAQVTGDFLHALRISHLPDWEVSAMLTKYATTMRAYDLSR